MIECRGLRRSEGESGKIPGYLAGASCTVGRHIVE